MSASDDEAHAALVRGLTGRADGWLRQSELGFVLGGISQSTVSRMGAGAVPPSPAQINMLRQVCGWDAETWERVLRTYATDRRAFQAAVRDAAEGARARVADRLEQARAGHEDRHLRVDRMAPFTTHFVAVDALGRDHIGRWWIDPSAVVHHPASNVQAGMLRAQRHDDGTVHLDRDELERLGSEPPDAVEAAFSAWGPGFAADVLTPQRPPVVDLARHTLRVGGRRATRAELRPVYMTTVLEVRTDDRVLVLEAERGEGVGQEDVAPLARAGARVDRLLRRHEVALVLTADNPEGRLLLPGEADQRNRTLRLTLLALVDGDERRVLETRARAPDDLHPWSEPSWTVLGVEPEMVAGIARANEQRAFFEVRHGELRLRWVDDLP